MSKNTSIYSVLLHFFRNLDKTYVGIFQWQRIWSTKLKIPKLVFFLTNNLECRIKTQNERFEKTLFAVWLNNKFFFQLLFLKLWKIHDRRNSKNNLFVWTNVMLFVSTLSYMTNYHLQGSFIRSPVYIWRCGS